MTKDFVRVEPGNRENENRDTKIIGYRRVKLPNRDRARISKTLERMPIIDDPIITAALKDVGL